MTPRGRFAPSPSGRMHLGNIATALLSWLSVKSKGGKWVLRIEDLDPQRSKREYAEMIEDDLHWLGLDWDEGGLSHRGKYGPYTQSLRNEFYERSLETIASSGLTYPCHCTRAEINATQAPHESDGRTVYAGTCRPPHKSNAPVRSTRIMVPDTEIVFQDRTYGVQKVNLREHCGDFILQRADGAWAYQLAVVVDDAMMGITEVVRGSDLLLSAAAQIHLYNILDRPVPEFAHVPLVCNAEGIRLSKRDQSAGMGELRKSHAPEEIIGMAAFTMGLTDALFPAAPADLLDGFSWNRVKHEMKTRFFCNFA